MLRDTLGNEQWIRDNASKIKEALPETWTDVRNINSMLQLGYRLKLIGIDWRSEDEFGRCMVFFERIGLMKRNGILVRRGG